MPKGAGKPQANTLVAPSAAKRSAAGLACHQARPRGCDDPAVRPLHLPHLRRLLLLLPRQQLAAGKAAQEAGPRGTAMPPYGRPHRDGLGGSGGEAEGEEEGLCRLSQVLLALATYMDEPHLDAVRGQALGAVQWARQAGCSRRARCRRVLAQGQWQGDNGHSSRRAQWHRAALGKAFGILLWTQLVDALP